MMQGSAASFDPLADAYDRYRIGYAPELYDALACEGVGAGSHVLDLACGTGLVAAELAERGAVVTGSDVSEPMLAHARARVPGATFAQGTAEALPFSDGAFDAVMSAQAFHWFDRRRALAECARVVRPGGLVAIWWKTLTRGDVVRALRNEIAHEAGLEPIGDILSDGFADFDRFEGLTDQRLRVIPWSVERTVGEIVGYERSRARSRAAYGSAFETYLERLRRRLGAETERYVLCYVHFLYLGRVAAALR